MLLAIAVLAFVAVTVGKAVDSVTVAFTIYGGTLVAISIRICERFRVTFTGFRRCFFKKLVVPPLTLVFAVPPLAVLACAVGIGVDPAAVPFAVPPLAVVAVAVSMGVDSAAMALIFPGLAFVAVTFGKKIGPAARALAFPHLALIAVAGLAVFEPLQGPLAFGFVGNATAGPSDGFVRFRFRVPYSAAGARVSNPLTGIGHARRQA